MCGEYRRTQKCQISHLDTPEKSLHEVGAMPQPRSHPSSTCWHAAFTLHPFALPSVAINPPFKGLQPVRPVVTHVVYVTLVKFRQKTNKQKNNHTWLGLGKH